MDILHYLKAKHDSIRQMCHGLQQTKVAKERKSQLEALVKTTQVYLTLERDFLYPELTGLFSAADTLVSVSQANAKMVDKNLKALVNLVSKQAFDADAFDDRLKAVGKAVSVHFEQEEQHLLPKMRDHIRTEEREDLGLVFADAEMEVLAALASDSDPVLAKRKRA